MNIYKKLNKKNKKKKLVNNFKIMNFNKKMYYPIKYLMIFFFLNQNVLMIKFLKLIKLYLKIDFYLLNNKQF